MRIQATIETENKYHMEGNITYEDLLKDLTHYGFTVVDGVKEEDVTLSKLQLNGKIIQDVTVELKDSELFFNITFES